MITKKNLVQDLVNEGRPATEDELRDIFRRLICPKMDNDTLSFFRLKELQRMVALQLFRVNAVDKGKHKNLVIQQIAIVVNIHPKTVGLWCRSTFDCKKLK